MSDQPLPISGKSPEQKLKALLLAGTIVPLLMIVASFDSSAPPWLLWSVRFVLAFFLVAFWSQTLRRIRNSKSE